MSKNRKAAKPLLRPAALSLLAQRCADTEWQRVKDLREMSLEALLDYVRSISPADFYQQFLEAQMSAEELAARRKAEAEKTEAEEQARRTIHHGKLPEASEEQKMADFVQGRGWHPATLTEAERIEAARQAEEERTGTRLIPPAEFEHDER